MKVFIGEYRDWIGPFQIADMLQHIGVSKDRCFEIGELLNKTPLKNVCDWIHSKKQRKVKVRIDKYDSWNADSTLAIIALPLLDQLRQNKQGAPLVVDEDVPAGLGLRASEAPAKENDWDTDANHFRRWDWVLNEIVWAFEQLQPDSNWEDQFHSGNLDVQWEPIEGKDLYKMVSGPNDTHKFDSDGYTAYSARIDRGLALFGKYFRNLWE